jgi:hypothetical protein
MIGRAILSVFELASLRFDLGVTVAFRTGQLAHALRCSSRGIRGATLQRPNGRNSPRNLISLPRHANCITMTLRLQHMIDTIAG